MIYLYHKIDKAALVLNQNLRMAGILNGGGKFLFLFIFSPSFLVSARGGGFLLCNHITC